jgi:DNA (cytosine-5)-methyltransferase 1
MLRTLSLFAGIGGFDIGLERTGHFKTAALCEIDPDARRVLAKHWPEVPCYEDVRDLSSNGITADCIVGGFPCQDISLAGRMAGADGEKSGLWREIIRLVADIRPRLVILENSPVLRSRGLETMLGELSALGYDAEWHCIPANAVDAPHRRDRLWLMAYPSGERDGLPPLEISAGWNQLKHRDWWDTEPGMGRMVDGLSAQPHRLRLLGNAVVPQIPELIGNAWFAPTPSQDQSS